MQLVLLGILLIVGYARADGVCSLPAETGPCRAAFRRFHYNEAAGKCEMFIYGGCRGNGNNFESKDECESQCSRVEKRDVGVCKQQPETGNCRMYFERYFFNSNTGTCEKFVYGGCGGNENNFETEEECGNHCLMKKREVEDVCSLPAHRGPRCLPHGMMIDARYTFDRSLGECRQVAYMGCGATANNFETKEACERRCGSAHNFSKRSLNELCMQPKKIGHCRARLPRVYYNSQTGRCERFNYGGCGGNKNNFKTMNECEASCYA